MNIAYVSNPLVRELLADPAGFKKRGRAYQLLEEYFAVLPVETLRPLSRHDETLVRHAAVWVASELGDQACVLLDDVVPLIDSDERFLVYHALEVTIVCAIGSLVHHFIGIPRALESHDDVIKVLAMRLLMRADVTQLQAAARFADRISANEDSHRRGLLLLVGCESVEPKEIQRLLHDESAVAAMYGAVAAKRIRDKYPELLQVAAGISDAALGGLRKKPPSLLPQGGVPNSGPSLGRQAIHATVPGVYYADQGYRLWEEGRYGWSIASHVASFVEAGLGVATVGWSTRYLAAQRAASAAIRSVPKAATPSGNAYNVAYKRDLVRRRTRESREVDTSKRRTKICCRRWRLMRVSPL